MTMLIFCWTVPLRLTGQWLSQCLEICYLTPAFSFAFVPLILICSISSSTFIRLAAVGLFVYVLECCSQYSTLSIFILVKRWLLWRHYQFRFKLFDDHSFISQADDSVNHFEIFIALHVRIIKHEWLICWKWFFLILV